MWIQNVSIDAIRSGRHGDAGARGVLIQITDCGGSFPVPKAKFDKVYQFDFHDSENDQEEWAPQPHHGQELVDILKMALDERRNIVVHCHMGYSRSAAIAEIGVEMGFVHADPDRYSEPNQLLIKLLRFASSN